MALNGAAVNLFRRDTGSIQGRSIVFLVGFSTYSKNQNIFLKKRAVETAKSNRFSLSRVEIRLRKIRL